jgi:hypothetical protein
MGSRHPGIRTRIRAAIACRACGAAKGEMCVSYTGRNGTVNGTPSPDVHGARWYDWMDAHAVARHAAQL